MVKRAQPHVAMSAPTHPATTRVVHESAELLRTLTSPNWHNRTSIQSYKLLRILASQECNNVSYLCFQITLCFPKADFNKDHIWLGLNKTNPNLHACLPNYGRSASIQQMKMTRWKDEKNKNYHTNLNLLNSLKKKWSFLFSWKLAFEIWMLVFLCTKPFTI